VHESAYGTSRQCVALHQFGSNWGKADILQSDRR
jgi:hypothetical protein